MTKTIKYEPEEGSKFTGRKLSDKLVIYKNRDSKGKSVTFQFRYEIEENKLYFIPISDIYFDANNRELIMPKGCPVQVAPELYRDIVPSFKYKGFNVFATDSDFRPVFKEVEFSSGRKNWIMAYDEIILHSYTEYDWLDQEFKEEFLSFHQLQARERSRESEDILRERVWGNDPNRIAKELNDELFEEAGYDFMD
ncbi:MAG: hypothetical protein J6W75_02855 [Bacteroidaceae bacterium]|nr:hypothetical protein [Prevotella sp.]MBP5770283.1 hypothetical protein [Bacteroidaceae bacterium]